MRKRTVITEDFEGVDCELSFEPVDWLDTHKARVGDKIVIAYCVSDHDSCWGADDLMGDCMGRIVDAHNGRDAKKRELYELAGCDRYGDKDLDAVWSKHFKVATERLVFAVFQKYELSDIVAMYEGTQYEAEHQDQEAYAEACLRQDCNDNEWGNVMYYDDLQTVLGEMWEEPEFWPGDPDAVMLDVYDHSGQAWSISGGGMQCRWDTSSGAGAWVPDKCLLDQIESDVKAGKDRRTQCKLYAGQFLDTYNDIISGNVYGCVVEWFDENGEPIDRDDCWGFIGTECVEETLKSEFFDRVCESLQAEYDKEVHTQGGRQTEIEA
jgi:hypothetical protein